MKKTPKADRQSRLEKALRENLKRRKQQSKARSAPDAPENDQNTAALKLQEPAKERDGE